MIVFMIITLQVQSTQTICPQGTTVGCQESPFLDDDDDDGEDDDDDDDDDGREADDDDDDDNGYPAYSHHDRFPPWWVFVRDDNGGNLSGDKIPP